MLKKKYEQYTLILTSILFIWVFKQGLAVSPGINITISIQIYLSNIWQMKYIQPLPCKHLLYICYNILIICLYIDLQFSSLRGSANINHITNKWRVYNYTKQVLTIY